MAKYIKCEKSGGITLKGKFIAEGTYYMIPETEYLKWASNTNVIDALATNDIAVSNVTDETNDIADTALALNFLRDIVITPTDVDGVPLARTKITQSGWHFQYHSIEWETSKLNGVYNKDFNENDLGYATIKFYDDQDVELTLQGDIDTDCVKTVVDFEIGHDFEVIGGTFKQTVAPTSNVRLWIIAAPDIPKVMGGTVEFTQGGLNLKRLGANSQIELDGKTAKMMAYDATYHTSKFRFVVRHGAGSKHPLFMSFKLFKQIGV